VYGVVIRPRLDEDKESIKKQNHPVGYSVKCVGEKSFLNKLREIVLFVPHPLF
jgi:hypothetical protein